MSVILITGCSSGFGKLAALAFARRGDTVFASMRDTMKSGGLVDQAAVAGVAVDVIGLDVRDASSVEAAVAIVLERAGHIDVLVNNAGVDATGPVEAFEDGELEAAFQTNVFGVHRVIRAVLPSMRARRNGLIILVSSVAGRWSFPFNGVYAATKHAAEALYDALYYELRPFNIRVAIVEPGPFATEIWNKPNNARAFQEGSKGWLRPTVGSDTGVTKSPRHSDREYGRMWAALVDHFGGEFTLADPAAVAELIVDIARDPQPERRYLLGDEAIRMNQQSADEMESETWRLLGYEQRQG